MKTWPYTSLVAAGRHMVHSPFVLNPLRPRHTPILLTPASRHQHFCSRSGLFQCLTPYSPGDSSASPRLVLELGLTPGGVATNGSAVDGGWMVGMQRYLEPSPDTWSYGDKFDLRALGYGSENEWWYNVAIIPAPGALLLASLGGTLVTWMRRRRSLGVGFRDIPGTA